MRPIAVERLRVLGPVPGWYRPFKLRAWRRAYEKLLRTDLESLEETLRITYASETLRSMSIPNAIPRRIEPTCQMCGGHGERLWNDGMMHPCASCAGKGWWAR